MADQQSTRLAHKNGVVLALNGSSLSPGLVTFLQSAERNARFLDATDAHPHAMSNVVRHELAAMLQAAVEKKRSFTFAEVDNNDKVLKAGTYGVNQLGWIHGGKLSRDMAFVEYVLNYNVGSQHPVYISTAGDGFLSGVIVVPQPDLAASLTQLIEAGPNVLAPDRAASMQRACTNSCCGKRDAELRQCSRCKSVFYCSAACQKADWSVHKKYCSK
jgi:hypothetical protein